MKVALFASTAVAALTLVGAAGAQDPPHPAAPPPTEATAAAAAPPVAEADVKIEESPPPPPRHSGLVLESSVGALGFYGRFRHVAPIGLDLRVQVGYEIFPWLMAFGEGELAFTDTSESDDPTKARAFPIFGFGGGARFTFHPTERFAFYFQGSVDGMKCDTPAGSLANLGYKDAESLGLAFGGRVGLEWYQVDRHIAFGASYGLRDATGFAQVNRSDTGLLWDGAITLRYTF